MQDCEEQFQQVKDIIESKNCYVTLEALAEIFDKAPKLDFVDCLFYGYKLERASIL